MRESKLTCDFGSETTHLFKKQKKNLNEIWL